MNKKNLRFLPWIAVIAILLVGAALGGGVGYALAQEEKENPDVVLEPIAEPGILVASVVPDGPAAAAGIKRGDILLEIDGQTINQSTDLMSHLQSLSAGSETEIKLLHGDEEKLISLTLDDRNGQPYLGLAPCGDGLHSIRVQDFKPGARVNEVVPDGPADQAGIEPGDLIVAVDGQEVDREHNLGDLISGYTPGDTVTLTVEQTPADESSSEEAREVTVTLGENPEKEGAAFLGLSYRQLPQIMMFRGMPGQPGNPNSDHLPFDRDFSLNPNIESGIFIRGVAEDGPAAEAGLSQGDIITAIDGEQIQNPREIVEAVTALKPGDTLTLTLTRPGEEENSDVTVTLGEDPEEEGKAYLGISIGGMFNIFLSDSLDDNLNGHMRFFFNELPFDFDTLPFDKFDFETLPFDEFDFDNTLPFEQFDFKQWCDDTGSCYGNTI